MIAKKYRLTEYELRKVLARKKPFFSYMFIGNVSWSKDPFSKVGILLSGKVARGSVNRNFFRRKFYEISRPYLLDIKQHIVFIPKKWTILSYKDINSVAEFEKNITFIYKKILETPQ